VQKAAGTKDATRISDPVFLHVQKAAGTKDAVHNSNYRYFAVLRPPPILQSFPREAWSKLDI